MKLTINNVPMYVDYEIGREAESESRYSPGYAIEIDINSVEVGGIDIIDLLSVDALQNIEDEIKRELE